MILLGGTDDALAVEARIRGSKRLFVARRDRHPFLALGFGTRWRMEYAIRKLCVRFEP